MQIHREKHQEIHHSLVVLSAYLHIMKFTHYVLLYYTSPLKMLESVYLKKKRKKYLMYKTYKAEF